MNIKKFDTPFAFFNIVQLYNNLPYVNVLQFKVPYGYYGIIKSIIWQYLNENINVFMTPSTYQDCKVFIKINEKNIFQEHNGIIGYTIHNLIEYNNNELNIYIPENSNIKVIVEKNNTVFNETQNIQKFIYAKIEGYYIAKEKGE